MTSPSPFRIDTACSDHEYLFVDIADIATVVIKAEAEGIVVDIYPQHCSCDPVATACALLEDLHDEEPQSPEQTHSLPTHDNKEKLP